MFLVNTVTLENEDFAWDVRDLQIFIKVNISTFCLMAYLSYIF